MLMTVNIKLSIIVIAEIIPSTDDTCLHQSISPQNGPSKVRPQITNVNPLLQYYRLFQLLLQPYAEHEGIITCSVSVFTSSTGSIHVFTYVNSPDSVNKFGMVTRVYHEITSFSHDDTYQ